MSEPLSPLHARSTELPPPQDPHVVGTAIQGEGISTRLLLRAVARHYLLVLGVAVLTTAATAVVAVRQPAMYRASSVLQLTNARRALTGGIEAVTSDPQWERSANPILSHLQVLRSRRVIGAVVDREGLQLEPISPRLRQKMLREVDVGPRTRIDTVELNFAKDEVVARLRTVNARARYGEPLQLAGVRFVVAEAPSMAEARIQVLPREVAIDRLLERLTARPRTETNIVDVAYVSEDPLTAQLVVNGVVQSFQELSVARAQQQSTMRRVFLEQQLADALLVQTRAQDALSAFRSREQVYSSREKLSAQQATIMDLTTRIQELAAHRTVYEALLAQYENARGQERREALRALVAAPGLSTSPEISHAYDLLIGYETARDSMLAGRWGTSPNHPDAVRLAGLISAAESQLVQSARSHVTALDAQIASLDSRQDATGLTLGSLPQTEAEEARLEEAVVTTRRVADHLREELQRSRIAEAVQEGEVEVIDWAVLPYRPMNPWLELKLGLGLLLGLALGGGAALLLEHKNTVIRRREELEAVFPSPTLGVIPSFQELAQRPRVFHLFPRQSNGNALDVRRHRQIVALTAAESLEAEMYRRLRLSLLCLPRKAMLRSLAITSAVEGEGKSTTAANLAVAFTERGSRVLLVDCDLRRSCLHKMFGVGLSPGLAQVIARQVRLEDAIRPTAVRGLDLLPAGMPPSRPDRFNDLEMERLLATFTAGYDLVVLDAPPLLAAASAGALANLVDGLLVVVRAGRTERNSLEEALRQLDLMGASVLGTILNDANGEAARYANYYSAYTSSHTGGGAP